MARIEMYQFFFKVKDFSFRPVVNKKIITNVNVIVKLGNLNILT